MWLIILFNFLHGCDTFANNTRAAYAKSMYSYYNRQMPQPKRKTHRLRHTMLALTLVGTGLYTWHAFGGQNKATASADQTKVSQTTTQQKSAAAGTATPQTQPAAAEPSSTECSSNTLSKVIIVSISKRHLWACASSSQQYDSAVVTGMQNIAADLTPTGTYQIYGKQTNLHLKGSDSTGSWDDFVYYWMPFLHNQYGTYGFHDATWRDSNAFGNIDPYSPDGSHGCVELPLATAKWLYNWTENGTTVQIIS